MSPFVDIPNTLFAYLLYTKCVQVVHDLYTIGYFFFKSIRPILSINPWYYCLVDILLFSQGTLFLKCPTNVHLPLLGIIVALLGIIPPLAGIITALLGMLIALKLSHINAFQTPHKYLYKYIYK